jgi:hypothetical protein
MHYISFNVDYKSITRQSLEIRKCFYRDNRCSNADLQVVCGSTIDLFT